MKILIAPDSFKGSLSAIEVCNNIEIGIGGSATTDGGIGMAAAYVYGPQKGANEKTVIELDKGLKNYSNIIKKDLGKDIKDIKGAGAAGGLGAGLMIFLKAEMKSGIDIIIESTELEEKIKSVDLVITGEGSIDFQTQFGKTSYGVAKLAKKHNKPVIGICGTIGEG